MVSKIRKTNLRCCGNCINHNINLIGEKIKKDQCKLNPTKEINSFNCCKKWKYDELIYEDRLKLFERIN